MIKNWVSREKADAMLPVDMYIGGVEHAVLHLLYSRFYTKFLCDIGVIDFDEPFIKLFNQGMITGKNGIKMSKSKGNVVSLTRSSGDTTFPLDLLILIPFFPVIIPWLKSLINGSSKSITPMSHRNLV